jgi:hypothetical protein
MSRRRSSKKPSHAQRPSVKPPAAKVPPTPRTRGTVDWVARAAALASVVGVIAAVWFGYDQYTRNHPSLRVDTLASERYNSATKECEGELVLAVANTSSAPVSIEVPFLVIRPKGWSTRVSSMSAMEFARPYRADAAMRGEFKRLNILAPLLLAPGSVDRLAIDLPASDAEISGPGPPVGAVYIKGYNGQTWHKKLDVKDTAILMRGAMAQPTRFGSKTFGCY